MVNVFHKATPIIISVAHMLMVMRIASWPSLYIRLSVRGGGSAPAVSSPVF